MVELGADTLTVIVPGLEPLMARSGLIVHEFKWDLIDYLSTVPSAPVRSLQEMLDLGLIHEALVPAMRARNAPESRESDAYTAAVAARDTLRTVLEAAMDRYEVDALAFPTVRTPPAIIGDPQRGSSCNLSANSGLPALSVPVGFTADSLPIGIELVGRTLADARLVAMGYAFEQATDHRREPWSTPALAGESTPARVSLDVRATDRGYEPARRSGVELRGRFDLDAAPATLSYDVTVRGVSAQDVFAVVLRYPDADGAWIVGARLSGPGVAAAVGTLVLNRRLSERLRSGAVVVEVFTRAHPLGAARAELRFE
jgi:hypothetical protein